MSNGSSLHSASASSASTTAFSMKDSFEGLVEGNVQWLENRSTATRNAFTRHAAVRPTVQLQIQEVHMWPHSNVHFTSCSHPVFSSYFLSSTSLLWLQTKTNRKNNSSALQSYSFYNREMSMRSTVPVWRHALFTRGEKTPHGISRTNWFSSTDFHDSGTDL